MAIEILAIGSLVFVNRDYDIVQRGSVCGSIVNTHETDSGEIKTAVQYEIKFPFPKVVGFGIGSIDDDEDKYPYASRSTFPSEQVYMNLEDAFYKKHTGF